MVTDTLHNPDRCARAWQLLRRAHRKVEHDLTEALASGCGLSLSEFDALLTLYLGDSSAWRMQDILGSVALSQPALSRLIDRLESRSLVVRTTGQGDGRVTLVCLTDAGREITARAIAIQTATIEQALTGVLSQSQQGSLLELLGRVAGD